MNNDPKFYNVSEHYGDRVPVTIDDYCDLNPEGIFAERLDEIHELDDDGNIIEVVARLADEDDE